MFQLTGRARNPASQVLLERGHPSVLVDAVVPPETYHRLPAREQWERTEALLDRMVVAFGLRELPVLLAGGPDAMSAPLLRTVAGCAPDLSEAIARLVRYLSIWERSVTLRLVDWHGLRPRVAVDSFVPGRVGGVGSQVLRESVLTVLVQYVRELASHPVAPSRVYLSHPPSSATSALEAHFGAEVVHRADGDVVEFDHDTLGVPTRHPDEAASTILIERLDRLEKLVEAQLASWPLRTRAEVRAGLDLGMPGIRSVARALGTSDRTLRRRLREADTSYAAIVESVRLDRARELLATTDRSMTSIAFDLGFAHPTAFSRAFRRQVGAAPSTWRARTRVDLPSASRSVGLLGGRSTRDFGEGIATF